MLGWMFKKKSDSPETLAASPAPAASAAVPAVADAGASVDALAAWQARLEAAGADDAALLDIAKQAPHIDLKCAAIAALSGEAALKAAEREFRTHDRRVHRAAKQRHEAAVAQRVARERASQLIESAGALLTEHTIPTNRLVELDRAWLALDAGLLDDARKDRFASLSAQLTALTRERGERALQIQRWMAAAQQALQTLKAASIEVAAGTTDRAALASASAAVRALQQGMPDHAGAAALIDSLIDALNDALQAGLLQAAAIEERLDLLDTLQSAPSPATPAEEGVEERPEGDALPSPNQRWQALAPVADPHIAALLNQRFEQAQPPLPAAPDLASAEQQEQRRAARLAARQQARQVRADAMAPWLRQAEAALEAGNLGEAHRQLVAIDAAVGNGAVPEALRGRLSALHAEVARLKGWQHWGGGRARDDLVQEAQTLAAATAAAVADPLQSAKLPVKALGDAIDDLRKRWKELDRLGGATNQTLWHRFDAALKTAHEPVAAHLDQLKARRKENLQARLQLLAALEAVDAAADAPDAATEGRADWKERARALDHFQLEWRKCGPVEHTVPHKARDKLLERMQASMARIEAPLQQARRVAQAEREQLVARAKALNAQAGASPQSRDLIARVRELQDEWQQHARALPLTRPVETALWAEFKAATDAVFVQRDAAASAFEAQLLANFAAKQAAVARLEAVTEQSLAGAIQRTLADVDAELRQAGDVPRHLAAALDARIQAAHQNALQLLAGSAHRIQQARFDALCAKLALCGELERSAAAGEGEAALESLGGRWTAVAPLPLPWEQALAARWQRAGGSLPAAPQRPGAGAIVALDSALLQLESALAIASPPAWQAARRDLKLRAMKAALEGRPVAGAVVPASIEDLMAAAIGHSSPQAGQSERLDAIIVVLRTRGA